MNGKQSMNQFSTNQSNGSLYFYKKGEKMKVFQTAQELVNRIETSKGKGISLVLLIDEVIGYFS